MSSTQAIEAVKTARRPNRHKYSEAKWVAALAVIAGARSVQAAADAIEVSRYALLQWRDKSEAHRAEWDAAMEGGIDKLEDEAVRRAFNGVEVDVFGSLGAGEGTGVVGSRTEYSDQLLTTLLKARRPQKFRENMVVSGDPANPIIHGVKVSFVRAGEQEAAPIIDVRPNFVRSE